MAARRGAVDHGGRSEDGGRRSETGDYRAFRSLTPSPPACRRAGAERLQHRRRDRHDGRRGKTLAGSDTSSFFVQGTFAQINADLATLILHGGRDRGRRDRSACRSMTSSAYPRPPPICRCRSPAGRRRPLRPSPARPETTTSSPPSTTPRSTPAPETTASFCRGPATSSPPATAANTVMGFVGGNTITTGSGNDDIRIGGSGSVVNAGLGVNTISDSGNGNTFVLPASGGT